MITQARKRLIFALDVDNAQEAELLVRMLGPEVGVFKLGLELFVSEGPKMVADLRRAGANAIFLDLKLHDIPATMRAAARQAVKAGVDMLTCHCDQVGIFDGLDLGDTKLLGITVLTSLGPDDLAFMGYPQELCDPKKLVAKRAELALKAGCHGVVCSGHEAQTVRGLLGPDALVVCPGIRMGDGEDSPDDQKRIMTPERAINLGASHIVVGRPIRKAKDPVDASRKIVESIAKGLTD